MNIRIRSMLPGDGNHLEVDTLLMLNLPREYKEQMIKQVQNFFYEERSEEIGHLSAELILDFMIKEIGPIIYNQAIKDAIKTVGEKTASLEDDLHSMEKPIKFKR